MRILHTADWHLGRIFYGVHLTDDQAHVLDDFIRLAKEVRPEVILIAGDVYDRAVPPPEAVALLDETLSRLVLDVGAHVIVIAGNHDGPKRLAFGRRLLGRLKLHIVGEPDGDLPLVAIPDRWGPVHFVPLPYLEPALVRERFPGERAQDHDAALDVLIRHALARVPDGARRVAVGHCFVAGGSASESERELAVGGAGQVAPERFAAFHYAALGHLHRPQEAGAPHQRYAGSLLKYSFSEADHRKSVTVVEIDAAGRVTWDAVRLTPRREVRCLAGCLRDILKGPKNGENRDDYLMVTLQDTGAILDAMGQLRAVYPNVLHIERPHLTLGGELRGPSGDHRRQSESDLFAAFFEQVTGNPLSGAEREAFKTVTEAVNRHEREAEA
ncbi:MAG: exonuclease SbcCD subunit D [Thermoanaerobacterales bacterium]|nr:exonuclease SbcCD subunit D [Thermoanaerobacterales bacterium]